MKIPYQKEIIQLQFPGGSGKQFYKLIKQRAIQWEKLTKFDIVLSRFDLVYERSHKLTDKISNKEFMNSSFVEFQELHPYKNIASERNRLEPIIQNFSEIRFRALVLFPNGKVLPEGRISIVSMTLAEQLFSTIITTL